MPKLTDTQLVLLANAANRNDGSMLPLPRKSKLDRETADSIFKDLIGRKLVAERTAARTCADLARRRRRSARGSDNHVSRPAGDRRRAEHGPSTGRYQGQTGHEA